MKRAIFLRFPLMFRYWITYGCPFLVYLIRFLEVSGFLPAVRGVYLCPAFRLRLDAFRVFAALAFRFFLRRDATRATPVPRPTMPAPKPIIAAFRLKVLPTIAYHSPLPLFNGFLFRLCLFFRLRLCLLLRLRLCLLLRLCFLFRFLLHRLRRCCDCYRFVFR